MPQCRFVFRNYQLTVCNVCFYTVINFAAESKNDARMNGTTPRVETLKQIKRLLRFSYTMTVSFYFAAATPLFQ